MNGYKLAAWDRDKTLGARIEVAHYLTSDVHLRLDQPERANRFGAWVDGLSADDPLIIVGDLCDFWFTARQSGRRPIVCPGLLALRRFTDRGGDLTILAGNHDAWLAPLFERDLGAKFVRDAMDLELDRLRIHIAHGHRLKTVGLLKKFMEGRAFLAAFRMTPTPVARILERKLDSMNARKRTSDDRSQLGGFTRFIVTLKGETDLVVLGHLHRTTDVSIDGTRLIVLGSWHEQSSHLKIEGGRADLVVVR